MLLLLLAVWSIVKKYDVDKVEQSTIRHNLPPAGTAGRPTLRGPAIAPFDAEQARAHQKGWADYLGGPVEYENSVGMKFRLIPPGEYLMGEHGGGEVAAIAVF